jgi:hypothetical protein
MSVEGVGPLAPGRRSVEDGGIDSISTIVSTRKVSKAGKSHSAKLGRLSKGISGGLRDSKTRRSAVELHRHKRGREK